MSDSCFQDFDQGAVYLIDTELSFHFDGPDPPQVTQDLGLYARIQLDAGVSIVLRPEVIRLAQGPFGNNPFIINF